jgi:DNA-directed RNA polymerase sigma subunit (sigma70/sigma32)
MRSHHPPKIPPGAPLDLLTERQRQVLELRQRQRVKAVAAMIGVSPDKVTKITQAALRRLRHPPPGTPLNSSPPITADPAPKPRQVRLTARQSLVLDCRAAGATLADLAAELGCVPETVRRIEKEAHRRPRIGAPQQNFPEET